MPWRELDTLECLEVQRFLDHLITVRKLAWATVNVYFSAYRFLYEQVLKRSTHQFSIPSRGRSGKRPGVLSREDVNRLIAAPRNLKHRALLAMTYGSGLRVSEVVRVRIADVDRGRMMLRVNEGKGRKDRYTVLSSNALILLEQLWRRDRPEEFFFRGKNTVDPMIMPAALRVADVIRSCWETYNARKRLPPHVAKVVGKLLRCRTAAMGGHIHVCDHCGSEVPLYNSCQSRHCPTCQTQAKEKWLDARVSEVLPVQYFHVVFTLPHDLNALVAANRRKGT